MTMKYGHSLDDWVGKDQEDIHAAASRDIYSIQPLRMCERHAIFCVSQKVHLVYVERMQFGTSINNAPMLIRTHAGAGHGTCVRRILAAVDVKAILVLGEGDDEVRL